MPNDQDARNRISEQAKQDAKRWDALKEATDEAKRLAAETEKLLTPPPPNKRGKKG